METFATIAIILAICTGIVVRSIMRAPLIEDCPEDCDCPYPKEENCERLPRAKEEE